MSGPQHLTLLQWPLLIDIMLCVKIPASAVRH